MSITPTNVTPAPSPPSYARDFLDTLYCPVQFTPLRDAVLLIPCGHTISEVAAKKMYQTANKKATCPLRLCNHTVTAYYPNRIMRDLVNTALGVKLEEALPLALATIQAKQSNEEKTVDDIPFPGLGAKFVFKGSSECLWSRVASSTLDKTFEFTSQTEYSMFGRLIVKTYRGGQVSISIDINPSKMPSALNYFGEYGFLWEGNHCEIDSHHPAEVKLLWKILVKHNEIPEDKLEFIQNSVESAI